MSTNLNNADLVHFTPIRKGFEAKLAAFKAISALKNVLATDYYRELISNAGANPKPGMFLNLVAALASVYAQTEREVVPISTKINLLRVPQPRVGEAPSLYVNGNVDVSTDSFAAKLYAAIVNPSFRQGPTRGSVLILDPAMSCVILAKLCRRLQRDTNPECYQKLHDQLVAAANSGDQMLVDLIGCKPTVLVKVIEAVLKHDLSEKTYRALMKDFYLKSKVSDSDKLTVEELESDLESASKAVSEQISESFLDKLGWVKMQDLNVNQADVSVLEKVGSGMSQDRERIVVHDDSELSMVNIIRIDPVVLMSLSSGAKRDIVGRLHEIRKDLNGDSFYGSYGEEFDTLTRALQVVPIGFLPNSNKRPTVVVGTTNLSTKGVIKRMIEIGLRDTKTLDRATQNLATVFKGKIAAVVGIRGHK